jgi:tetratricopeptide (TPR) repeat protein
MNSECQKYKEIIADYISGILPDSEVKILQQHLNECKDCSEYASALEKEDKQLSSLFAAIDSDMKTREQKVLESINFPEQKEKSSRTIFQPFIKLAAAAAIVIVVLFGLNKFGNSSIAWADVVEKFQSVEFFSAVFYEKDDALAQPEQIELWMGQGGNVRMRMGPQVIFGQSGNLTKAFDISKRSQAEPDPRAKRMLEMLAGMGGQFSLDTLLKTVSGGKLTNVTPLVNSDAIISEDLVVFDSKLNDIQWMRIWALRESKLPVHLRIWGSRDGYCLEAFITYSNKQPAEFFDPNAFEQVFRQQQDNNKSNIAYAFLTDPGGEDITPKDMFNKSGYHIPIIKQAGITKEGAIWILAGQSRNRMPNGNEFYGFSQMTDNLDRTYIDVGGAWRLGDDTSLNIFLPIDFPFDNRRPSKITLFCEVKEYNPNIKPELVGTIDLTQWDVNAPCPALFGGFTSVLSWKISLAYKFFADEYSEKLSRLVETIPAWREQPDNKNLLQLWIRLSYREKDYAQVINIGQVFVPLLLKNPRESSRYAIEEYLLSLAITGKIDEAAKLFKQIDEIDVLSPRKSEKEPYEQFKRLMVEFMAEKAELELEQLSKIVGFNINQKEEYRNAVERAKNAVVNRKLREAAEKRRQEIADYYKNHPLPEKMELIERSDKKKIYFMNIPNTVPDHEDYKIQSIKKKVKFFVSDLINFNNIQPYDLVPMRVEDVNEEQELNADLIYKEGTSRLEKTEFALNHFGIELVIEDGPSRKVLVAKYNGQSLKDFKDVTAPIPYDGQNQLKAGVMSTGTSRGFTLVEIFDDLARQQNKGIEKDGDKLVIFNETGISFEDGSVSSETAFWPDKEGLELAKKWFNEEFGVTFTEETRPMKTYVIKKRTE